MSFLYVSSGSWNKGTGGNKKEENSKKTADFTGSEFPLIFCETKAGVLWWIPQWKGSSKSRAGFGGGSRLWILFSRAARNQAMDDQFSKNGKETNSQRRRQLIRCHAAVTHWVQVNFVTRMQPGKTWTFSERGAWRGDGREGGARVKLVRSFVYRDVYCAGFLLKRNSYCSEKIDPPQRRKTKAELFSSQRSFLFFSDVRCFN